MTSTISGTTLTRGVISARVLADIEDYLGVACVGAPLLYLS